MSSVSIQDAEREKQEKFFPRKPHSRYKIILDFILIILGMRSNIDVYLYQ